MQLEDLRKKREAIVQLAALHGVENIRVFGSVIRGEYQTGSDIDLLVSVRKGTGLLKLVALENKLADMLSAPVDIVSEKGLSPHLAGHITESAVPL